ncbi:MAG: shikimate dehydrogenase [Campylobacterota bacterium]|nr:shikimate dehydrogenase [Campylobacterota bacterium]
MTNTKKFTIFGNPVEHSKSPQMHNAGFEFLKLDSLYNKTQLEDGSTIKDVFLSNNIQGANITVPHKEDAYENADEVRGLAKSIGAVNTYINENGKVIAYNTDAPGFMKAIEEFGEIKTAIILGAGGTAKAIAVAFREKGIKTTVLNRSANRLEFFKNLGCEVYSWEEYPINGDDFELVVNSTSAGLKDDNYPAPINILEHILKSGKYAVDCIYGKMTPFLNKAKERGLIYKDGEDMLLYQGVIAFELFTGTKADKHLIEAMRKGLKG